MSPVNGIRTDKMSEARRQEIEELDQWELLELIQQIRDAIWLTEDGQEAIKQVRELVGVHEDVEDEEDYDTPADYDDELPDEDDDTDDDEEDVYRESIFDDDA